MELRVVNYQPVQMLSIYHGRCTQAQSGALVGLVKQGMEYPDDDFSRYAIMSELLHRKITSFHQITFWEASALIINIKSDLDTKWRLSEDGYTLIYGAELKVSNSSGDPDEYEEGDPEETYALGDPNLSDLQPAIDGCGGSARGIYYQGRCAVEQI